MFGFTVRSVISRGRSPAETHASIMTEQSPHILHVIPYLGAAMGGPTYSLAAYTAALATAGRQVTVASLQARGDGREVPLAPCVRHLHAKVMRAGNLRPAPGFSRRVTGAAEYTAVHSHGLWTYASLLADSVARRQKIPHIIAPCGMLQPGALNRSRAKKAVCRLLFQDRVLRRAACLHAKSPAEFQGIRDAGINTDIAVIANPVQGPPAAAESRAAAFKERHGLPGSTRLLLYLGRLHPVKGLKRLADSWAQLQGSHPEWHLMLAGPDEDGYRDTLEAQLHELNCHGTVSFCGALDSDTKWSAYAAADLFVMPSDFENFGTSIVEALASGTPVVTTTGTPWRELTRCRAGWWVAPDVSALTAALHEGMQCDQDDRREMGRNACQIARRFAPDRIGADLVALYDWLVQPNATRPAFIKSCLPGDGIA